MGRIEGELASFGNNKWPIIFGGIIGIAD